MWDKLNFFSWTKKKATVGPVQREASVTLTNGDKRITIQRSPSGTNLASSSSVQHGLDDDNSSEASTSLNFGFKTGTSSRRDSSFSFSREPLDLPTWSNVTSPGFTSRLVQQASGNSPLKEFNDSLSHSPFRKSPYRDLGLGELPFVNYSRKPRVSSPVFPTVQRATSLRSGVSSSVYNRDRRKNARLGQTFVRIAPIDPTMKANVSISRKSTSPPVDMGSNGGPYPPRGSPRAGNEQYRSEGLGGIPQQELAMRFNRLWPSSPGGPVPGPGRPSSPTSPSNIMEALTAGRKRAREQDTYYPPNATPPSVSPPSKISIGIGDTPVRPQVSKRVKFLGGPESHDRPMMVGYPGMGTGDNEPLSSESILEQMNQTEKRFLPDSTSTPYSMQKKGIRMPGSDDQPSALQSALRKRRSQTSIMSAVEEEVRGEKIGRFCTCNECYAEAAGISTQDQSFQKDGSLSPRASDEKSTNTGDSRSRETCDKGVSTTEFDRGAYFREVFRKADKKKSTKDDDIDDLMPYGKTVITKEMYERDKRKRIERYYRILKLKPPGGNIFDPCPGNNSSSPPPPGSVTTVDGSNGASSASATSPSSTSVSTLSGNNAAVTSFGSPAAADLPNSGGLSFSKQTSPAATLTTTSCATITCPSSTTGISFGTSALSSTATTSTGSNPTTSTMAPPAFGSSATTTVSAFGSGSVAVPTGTSRGNTNASFSFGGSTTGQTQLPTGSTLVLDGINNSATTTTAAPTSTFSAFGSQATSTAAPPPTYESSTSNSALGVSSNNNSNGGFSFGGSGTVAPPQSQAGTTPAFYSARLSPVAPKPSTPAPTTESAGFSFGQSKNTVAITSASNPTSIPAPGMFQFGQPQQSAPTDPVNNTSTQAGSTTSVTIGGSTAVPSAIITSPTTSVISGNNAPVANTGFSFGSSTVPPSSSGGFSFGKPTSATGTTVSTTSCPTITSPSSTTGSGFGASSLSAPAPTSSMGDKSSTSTMAPPAFGSFGSPAPTATTTAAPAFGLPSSGSVFGGASSGNANASFSFGGSSTAQTQPTAANSALGGSTNSAGGFNFGSSSGTSSSSGFAFGKITSPAATTASTSVTSTSHTTGNIFGASGLSNTVPTSPPNTNIFGATAGNSQVASPFGQSAGGAFGSSSSTTAPGSGGGFNFAAVPNPLAGNKSSTSAAVAPTPTFGSFGSQAPATAASPPAFGSSASSSIFGGGSNTSNSGFPSSFGGSGAMSPPQSQAGSSGFAFGGNAPQPSVPTLPSSTGFSFGQSKTAVVAPTSATSNPAPGVFQFGQPQQATLAGPQGASPFQFGQQAAQGVPGGFNFSAAAPAPSPGGGQAMFSLGSASTAPRRRDARRRLHR